MARRVNGGSAPAAPRRAEPGIKLRTASLSVASNSALILLKVIGGTITGSVALLTEAVHSSIDLVASIVAFFSVRQAGKPADESHRYGHERFENLAAAIEGVLILVGSALDELIKQGKAVGDTKVDLVRSPIGMVVRAGAPKPDISTVDALRKTLLDAKSIAYSTALQR